MKMLYGKNAKVGNTTVFSREGAVRAYKLFCEFYYKDMDESSGPYAYDCPKSILDLLSPTTNEFALNWRRKCYANIERKKDKNSLSNLPLGTIIEVILPFDLNHYAKGEKIQLTKEKFWHNNRTFWATKTHRFTSSLMKSLQYNYTLLQKGG